MAVTYVSLDHYLKENSYMCFVLPQTFIKSSKGGEGFENSVLQEIIKILLCLR